MAEKVQYLSLEGLKTYDGLIKKYVNDADAKSIKTVKFDKGTRKISFYKTESPALEEAAYLEVEIPETDLSNYLEKIAGATEGNVVTVNSDGTLSDSSVALTELAKKSEIGDLTSLNTYEKETIVGAINELETEIANTAAGDKLTIVKSEDSQYAAVYTFSQGGQEIETKINIPKDMVISSGSVQTYTEETLPKDDNAPKEAGKYIVLKIANSANDTLYISVKDLVDIYTAEPDANQIQITVSPENVISATIVASSVTATELADGAVETTKIKDEAITNDKLSADLKQSITNADSALQKEDITTGTEQGSISVDGTDVTVNGFAELKETVDSFEAISNEQINGLFSE